MKRNPLRFIWIAAGMICLGLGTVGIVLPILPTVPFYMATLFCFAKSSRKLHEWFLGTGLYRRHLESFAQDRTMTIRSKCTIMGTVTVVMGGGFFMMRDVPIGRICLAVVWAAHVMFFLFGIKTLRVEE